ncbi:ATP-binding protein [Microcystis elabens FACHB-917]|nr:ATP-binding protein [Microcystis elabens FACHB-917]
MPPPFTHGTCESSFPSKLEATQNLLDWFDQLRPAGLDPLVWIQAQTALVEGFTNAVRHAHGPLVSPPPVKVSLGITATHLQLQIHDQGAPFKITSTWTNDAKTEKASVRTNHPGGQSNGDVNPNAVGLPELPDQDSHWGLIILGRLRRDFGWMIRYDHLPNGGNKLVMERALACDFRTLCSI